MATTAANVAPNNATAAEFRAWAQFVHDVFANGGWTQTGDTGQINLVTVGAPGAANTKMGYEVWAMADSLQATHPVILKLNYGSGAATNNPAIWFTIGTATDGAGNLIDSADGNRAAYLTDFYTQASAPIFARSNSATTHTSFGSGTTSRAVVAAFEAKPGLQFTGDACDIINVTVPDVTGAAASFTFLFSIERARDEAGDLSGDHIFVMWTGSATNGAITANMFLKTSNQWVPTSPLFGTVNARPASTEVIYASRMDSLLPSTAAAYPIIPFEQGSKPTWPGINVLVSPHSLFKFTDPGIGGDCNPTAFNATYVTGRTAEVTINGVARTYRTVAGLRGGQFAVANRDDGAFIWVLYE